MIAVVCGALSIVISAILYVLFAIRAGRRISFADFLQFTHYVSNKENSYGENGLNNERKKLTGSNNDTSKGKTQRNVKFSERSTSSEGMHVLHLVF